MSNAFNKEKINELLSRGVGEFIDPDGIFRKKLETNPEKIVIKFGIDPTRPDIHLGHAVVLHKLREFQDLGCKVIFLIGDFTALIGDPTGKSKIRPELEYAEIQKNMNTFLLQVGKILIQDENTFSWTMNSDWLTSINDILAPEGTIISFDTPGHSVFTTPPLPGNDILAKAFHWKNTRKQTQQTGIHNYSLITLISILRKFTLSRLIERDMFQERLKKTEPIFMHEMMYPIIQGIDSDAIANIFGSCDMEVGGTDQTFNMLVGRDIMTMNKKIPQAVLAFKILEGLDGKEKMSKSLGNYVGITETPISMFRKIMTIPDSLIVNYFELCTDVSEKDINDFRKILELNKDNPKNIKMKLAYEIVKRYHEKDLAEKAKKEWEETVSGGGIPEDITELSITDNEKTLIDIILKGGIIVSKGKFRRLLDEGAVTNLDTNEKIIDPEFVPQKGMKFKVGKRRFIKIV